MIQWHIQSLVRSRLWARRSGTGFHAKAGPVLATRPNRDARRLSPRARPSPTDGRSDAVAGRRIANPPVEVSSRNGGARKDSAILLRRRTHAHVRPAMARLKSVRNRDPCWSRACGVLQMGPISKSSAILRRTDGFPSFLCLNHRACSVHRCAGLRCGRQPVNDSTRSGGKTCWDSESHFALSKAVCWPA